MNLSDRFSLRIGEFVMSLFDWFANRRKESPEPSQPADREREIADGLWTKCDSCGALTYTKDLRANQMVCLECDHHMRVYSDERIRQLIDADTWQPMDETLHSTDPLGFRDRKPYSDRLREMQDKTKLVDAVQTGLGKLKGNPVALGVMDFRFMGGSPWMKRCTPLIRWDFAIANSRLWNR